MISSNPTRRSALSILLGAAVAATGSASTASDSAQAISRLQQGGLVVYFRHGVLSDECETVSDWR